MTNHASDVTVVKALEFALKRATNVQTLFKPARKRNEANEFVPVWHAARNDAATSGALFPLWRC